MAVVVPLIFTLFLASLEMTAVNFARQTAGNASYEAARKLILPGGTEAEAQQEGLRIMNLVGVGSNAAVTVSQTDTTASATVSVPASSVSWGLLRFTSSLTITQSCTLTKE
jgi:Flp pilus assembly protein TadG